jgi:hypothetical protein
VPAPVRCEVSGAVEDLIALRAAVLHVHDHRAPEKWEPSFSMEYGLVPGKHSCTGIMGDIHSFIGDQSLVGLMLAIVLFYFPLSLTAKQHPCKRCLRSRNCVTMLHMMSDLINIHTFHSFTQRAKFNWQDNRNAVQTICAVCTCTAAHPTHSV